MGVVACEAGAEVEDATETVHGDPFGTIVQLYRDINRSLDSIKRNVNWLVDRVVRKSAAEELGELYIESGQADSIERLLYFLPDEQLSTGKYAGQKLERALALAEAIATRLVEERVPERLLQCIAAKVQLPQAEGSSARAWVDDGGRVDCEALDAFLTVCEDAPLREALQKLRRVVTMGDAKEKTELLTHDSAGKMCLVAAAHSNHYLNTSSTATSFILPPDNLWFDMKGQLMVERTGKWVRVNVGHSVHSQDYEGEAFDRCSQAVEQLGIRIGALRWMASTCIPHPEQYVVTIGRLIVARAEIKTEDVGWVEDELRELAMDSWDYDLKLYRF